MSILWKSNRIRIGVTGHRKIDNPDVVKEQIRHVLNETLSALLDKNLGMKGSEAVESVQICVISSLAEGADRIVVREVLKYPNSRLEAVLPLCLEDYLEDFTDTESKTEFTELLRLDSNPVWLHSKPLKAMSSSNNSIQFKQERDQAYYHAGEYIVNHCDVLLAVWDGKEERGKGGTGQIVKVARKKGCSVIVVPISTG